MVWIFFDVQVEEGKFISSILLFLDLPTLLQGGQLPDHASAHLIRTRGSSEAGRIRATATRTQGKENKVFLKSVTVRVCTPYQLIIRKSK